MIGALSLVPVGDPPTALLEVLPDFLQRETGLLCSISPQRLDPAPAYLPARDQYDTRPLLVLLERLSVEGELVMGMAEVDLCSSIFTFVFGEAVLQGSAAIFSLHRLRASFYGLQEGPGQLLARVRKEALHETGHLLGLVHCRNPNCVMRFSGAAEEVDLKPDRFCPRCAEQIASTDRGHDVP